MRAAAPRARPEPVSQPARPPPSRSSSASMNALSFYFSQATGKTECSTPQEALETSSTSHAWQRPPARPAVYQDSSRACLKVAVCQNNLRFRHVVGAQPVAHPSQPHELPYPWDRRIFPNYLHNLKLSLSLGAASCIVSPSNLRSRSGIYVTSVT